MCGRFTLTDPDADLAVQFNLPEVPDLAPRYNIAPSQLVAAVRVPPGSTERELALLRWGLIPFWAKDPAIGNRMINARSETVAEKPAFRSAFRRRRCLVVADGFYEWQKVDGKKQPYYIRMLDGRPFGFAGMWERWESPDAAVIESCTLLTSVPNELLRPLHNRMPVILQHKDYEQWLQPENQQVDVLQALLRPFPSEAMDAYRVSRFVNSPDNDDPKCIEPYLPAEDLRLPGL
jgi:putative SOS response-associated peptidase YedK